MIPDIERAWLRNDECFITYGKSFQFFKKWEGDLSQARILRNRNKDDDSDALFDKDRTTYVERIGKTDDIYAIVFDERVMIHAITLGTVPRVTRYSDICFELYSHSHQDQGFPD